MRILPISLFPLAINSLLLFLPFTILSSLISHFYQSWIGPRFFDWNWNRNQDQENPYRVFFYFGEKREIFLWEFVEKLEKMGISHRIMPACDQLCVCCPAMRTRSRQPVKRYKKLISDSFPRSPVSLVQFFIFPFLIELNLFVSNYFNLFILKWVLKFERFSLPELVVAPQSRGCMAYALASPDPSCCCW